MDLDRYLPALPKMLSLSILLMKMVIQQEKKLNAADPATYEAEKLFTACLMARMY